jgi:phasin family protein
MATKKTEFNAFQDYVEQAGRAFAPATEFGTLFAANVEKLARFQYELQFGLDQMNASVRARDLGTLASRQAEIAGKFVEKAAKRQQDFTKLTTDAQANMAKWFEESTEKVGKAA